MLQFDSYGYSVVGRVIFCDFIFIGQKCEIVSHLVSNRIFIPNF